MKQPSFHSSLNPLLLHRLQESQHSHLPLFFSPNEGKLSGSVMLVYFRSEKKNFCKAVTNPHSLFCFIVIAIVFSFQWSPSIHQFHDGPRRTRQRSANVGAKTGGGSK